MIFNVSKSLIGSDGKSYIYGMLEKPTFDENGLWNSCKGFDITNDYKKQTSTISTFVWIRGVPANWKVVKILKNEIVDISEVEQKLKEIGIF